MHEQPALPTTDPTPTGDRRPSPPSIHLTLDGAVDPPRRGRMRWMPPEQAATHRARRRPDAGADR